MPGGAGALAVVVMPRYVLHNSLSSPLQYRQQGTLGDRELAAGGARPVRDCFKSAQNPSCRLVLIGTCRPKLATSWKHDACCMFYTVSWIWGICMWKECMHAWVQVRWTDASLPKRLCVRVQEAGWLWSGGVALDSPGDLFVKIRHRSCSAAFDGKLG